MARKPRDPNAPVKVPTSVSLPMPPVLREKLQAEMPADSKKSLGSFVAEFLAKHFSIALPPRRTRSRYATTEERIAAQTKARQDKAALIKRLLAEHEARLAAQANGTAPAVAEAEAIVADANAKEAANA